jgi:hypothetical protein
MFHADISRANLWPVNLVPSFLVTTGSFGFVPEGILSTTVAAHCRVPNSRDGVAQI